MRLTRSSFSTAVIGWPRAPSSYPSIGTSSMTLRVPSGSTTSPASASPCRTALTRLRRKSLHPSGGDFSGPAAAMRGAFFVGGIFRFGQRRVAEFYALGRDIDLCVVSRRPGDQRFSQVRRPASRWATSEKAKTMARRVYAREHRRHPMAYSTFPAAAMAPPNGGAREIRRPNIPGLTNGPDHSRTIRHDTKVRISRPTSALTDPIH